MLRVYVLRALLAWFHISPIRNLARCDVKPFLISSQRPAKVAPICGYLITNMGFPRQSALSASDQAYSTAKLALFYCPLRAREPQVAFYRRRLARCLFPSYLIDQIKRHTSLRTAACRGVTLIDVTPGHCQRQPRCNRYP